MRYLSGCALNPEDDFNFGDTWRFDGRWDVSQFDFSKLDFKLSRFVSERVHKFEMEPLGRAVTLKENSIPPARVQLTLFSCCDIYGHKLTTHEVFVRFESVSLGEFLRYTCERCDYTSDGKAYEALVGYFQAARISLEQARVLLKIYLQSTGALPMPKLSFRDITTS